jgi:UDP-N-acetylmuramate dehydrogenase
MNEELIAELRKVAPVKLNEPMARHTTFGVGGPADIYVAVKTEEQLRSVFSLGKRYGVPVLVFGTGSNMLVSDSGVRGLAIHNMVTDVSPPVQNGLGFKINVGSGAKFSRLAGDLARAGYAGIEWACGIPGSVGGAIVTNAGAQGGQLSDVLVSARVSDANGEVRDLTPAELDLGYRQSAFTRGKIKDSAVLSVQIRVQPGDAAELQKRVREMKAERKRTQPPDRNCGSIFKNPAGKRAWQYINDAGLKQYRIGNAAFSELHSNFIQNLGGATAKDILALIRLAQERVKEQFGVELQTEVMFVGEFA